MASPASLAVIPATAPEDQEGSTRRLVQLCAGYFLFYVLTGVAVKYFQGPAAEGFPGFSGVEYLVYNTAGSCFLTLAWVLYQRWYRIASNRRVLLLGQRVPVEYLYIVPSGICTAVVVPTTTLMYSLPISVMVAMVIMRGSVIVIGRMVDAIQIRQGILKKRVFWEEDAAVVFAVLAVSVHLLLGGSTASFDFVHSPAALVILGSYVTAYFLRIYIMNYYKNTRAPGVRFDNKGFLGVEQVSATIALSLGGALVLLAARRWGSGVVLLTEYHDVFFAPRPGWHWALVSGIPFGIVTFFSVFIFMFKGRTATFAGLVNRLTSLVAGTAATVLFCVVWGGKAPQLQDWISLGLIFVAVYFLARAEKRRARRSA